MSILNNILAIPNYELKYELQFTSRAGNTYKVEIHEKDGAAGATPIQMIGAGNSPFSMKQSFSDQNVFREIAGTQYTLKIIADTYNQYIDFRYANNRQFYMKLWKSTPDGLNFFQIGSGYYMPETFEQDHGGGPDAVMLRFTDNLGTLKDEPFENNDGSYIEGDNIVSDIIAFILSKAGSQIQFFDMIPIRPYHAANPVNGFLRNVWVDCLRFRDMSCEEVLRSLIGAINGQLVSSSNRFFLWVPTYLTTNHGIIYERDGTIAHTGVSRGVDFSLEGNVRPQGRATKTIERPIKEIELSFKKELRSNLLEYRDFSLTAPTHQEDPYPVWQNLYYTDSPYEYKDDNVILAPYTINTEYPDQPNYYLPALDIPFGKTVKWAGGYLRVTFRVQAFTTKIVPTRTEVDIHWRISLGHGHTTNNYKDTIRLGGGYQVIERVVYVLGVGSPVLWLCGALIDIHRDLSYISIKKDWEVITVKDKDGTLYEREESEIIPIDSDNSRKLEVEKDYGHNTPVDDYYKRPWYTYYNNFACRPGGGSLAVVQNFRYMLSGDEITLPDFVRSTLVNYYLLNKLRVSLAIVVKQYWPILNLPRPYSKVIIPHLDQYFLFGSYNWDLRMDTYDLELIGYTAKPWVLQGNKWYDGGVWLDQEIWQEELEESGESGESGGSEESGVSGPSK